MFESTKTDAGVQKTSVQAEGTKARRGVRTVAARIALTCFLSAQATFGQSAFQVVNHFSAATDYFGSHYSDQQVWLYFLNTGGAVTYESTAGGTTTVGDAVSVPLSSVVNGTFQIGVGSVGTKVFAGLGATTPFSGTNGPGLFDTNSPYALAEWTVNGNSLDNTDLSYIDQFSFPSRLTVTNSLGKKSAGFPAGTTAASVVSALSAAMPTSPTGPNNDNYPSSAGDVGYGPVVPTVSGDAGANRWIGSSKYWISAPDSNDLRSLYTYAPTFNDYLQHLQDNVPTVTTSSGNVTGWYVDYSGNNGYSGYLNVTGNATVGFGLQVSNIRVNTQPSAATGWVADPNAGNSTTGTITIAANGATVPYDATTNVVGNWTDATIYSGASLINGDFASGPVVTGTGDFGPTGAWNSINPTFLASISAAMATGLLGSQLYLDAFNSASDPKSTMYWFNTMTREQSTQLLFGNAWGPGQEFFDPFWANMAELTGMEGYLSPFNDRWQNFSPDFALVAGGPNLIVWELGTPVPEPATAVLALLGLAGVLAVRCRRR